MKKSASKNSSAKSKQIKEHCIAMLYLKNLFLFSLRFQIIKVILQKNQQESASWIFRILRLLPKTR